MKFEKNCKYYVQGEGFESVLYCYDRINHRDGSSSVKFFIYDLKITKFLAGASTFIYRLNHDRFWYINPNTENEYIDFREFIISAENKIKEN